MKKFAILCVTALFALSLTGCFGGGGGGNPTPSPDPTPAPAPDPAPVQKKLEFVELAPGTQITQDGDYAISDLYTDVLSDAAVMAGWIYYYGEGASEVIPWKEWVPAKDMYTSLELYFDMKNLKDPMEKTFQSRFNGYVVFNADFSALPNCKTSAEYMKALQKQASQDPNVQVFPLTNLQRNPGQVDPEGYEIPSKDAVLLDANQSAMQNLIADVSEDFYRSWENVNALESMWAVFSYDDGTVYMVDLRQNLKETGPNY